MDSGEAYWQVGMRRLRKSQGDYTGRLWECILPLAVQKVQVV
jgi:hypothetical protein